MAREIIWMTAAGVQRAAYSDVALRVAPPDAVIVDEADLPERALWEAWTIVESAVAVDMAKAREIWRNRIRGERDVLLPLADAAVNLAQDNDDADAEATARAWRRALRDAPADPAIEGAVTPADLVAVWPACLVVG